jgi:hypothetical protein
VPNTPVIDTEQVDLLPYHTPYTTILTLSLAPGETYAKRSEACVKGVKGTTPVIHSVKGGAV